MANKSGTFAFSHCLPSTAKAVKVVYNATQQTLDKWFQAIDTAITQEDEFCLNYDAKKKLVKDKLLEARNRGISARQLSKITGIPHQTISEWVKQAKEEAKP